MGKDRWEVRNVKAIRGHDGQGFNASLYLNGKKVAFVDDDGYGGGYNYEWLDRKKPLVKIEAEHNGQKCFRKGTPTEAKWMKHVGGCPAVKVLGDMMDSDSDMVIASMIDHYEEAKVLKRWSKKNTMFRLKGDKAGTWRTLKEAWSEAAVAWITNKYGTSKIETIYKPV